jgi:thiosulfate dehydrogenase (quinone) large subunit
VTRTAGQTRVPALALLPLRFFFGATFLFAGFDKLLDPAFFDASSARSIQAQLEAFERLSPLGPLIQLGRPYAVEIGLLIAVAEIGVGLGALSGIAYRLAAVGGAALSILFWLAVSWTTRPFYLGPDLPYALGWLTLALAGHGGLLVLSSYPPGRAAHPHDATTEASGGPVLDRRAVLQAGVLAAGAFAAAALAVPLRLLGITTGIGNPATGGPGGSPIPTTDGSGSPPPTGSPSVPPLAIATVADLERAPSRSFTVPFAAPAPLPAGDPGIIVKLADGTYAAFDSICPHAGCTVDWDPTENVLLCPCHGAAFDAANRGAVLAGPAEVPLVELPIVIDQATGQISLRA